MQILNWTKPTIIKNNELVDFSEVITGVYIWGYFFEHKFMPYYVGQGINIYKRLAEHVSFLLSGKYAIFHKENLHNFKVYNAKKQFEYLGNWPKSLPSFLARRKEIQSHIDFMVDNFCYTYAKVEDISILLDVEKYIINLIGLKNLSNTRGGKSKIMEISNEGNQLILDALMFNKLS